MVRAKRYVLVKNFRGEPKRSDFNVVEEDLPPINDGEILTEAEFFSVDPYMRAYMDSAKVPVNMIGQQVARVVESKNPKFAVGSRLVASFGWRDKTIVNPDTYKAGMPLVPLPDFGPYPASLALGVLGMPGNTAYFGLLELCKPKPGETVVVTGAAGAVGAHVGQIAKNLGCRVIGFAGSDAKCNYIKKEHGFDYAFNYKTVNGKKAIAEAAPNGVDCFFDNVGGELSSIIIYAMNDSGRVAVCGSICSYNEDISALPKATILQPAINLKQLRVEGFLVPRWSGRWMEGIEANMKWLKEGKLKYKEEIWEGFDNIVDGFVGMLRGENTGKAIIKV